MRKLRRPDYERLLPLFDDLRYNLVIDSIVAGNTPAWVYADDLLSPQTGWMWNRMGTMLLAGEPDNNPFNRALSARLVEGVAPDARRRQVPLLTLHYSPSAWEDEVDSLLPGAKPRRMWRRFYVFDQPSVDWRERLPSDSVVQPIDARLLQRDHLENLDRVLGWIHSFWHGVEDFAETGFGFCLVRDGVIASWCLTVYAAGHDVELGLATAPGYRNRGYATLTAAASVEHGVARGFKLHWHCDEQNLPSIRVAEKVGFHNPTRYQVYTYAV
jgi:RimJ/RimL family protein N-acetyltransferase